MDTFGCTYVTFIDIGDTGTERPLVYYVPNSIIANGDPGNRNFYLQTTDPNITSYDLYIFNRWGGLMFELSNALPNNASIGWDGTVDGQFVQNNVYVYQLVIRDRQGNETTDAGDLLVIN